MRRHFPTFPHAYKEMGERTSRQAEGKEPPSWGSGGPSLTAVGLRTGLALGVVTAIVGSCTPFVEWMADHVPEKRMGVLGVGLILIGFSLQSVQYWLALLDVSVQ